MGLAMPAFAETEAAEGLKIDKAGTYTLTGSMRGSVVVDPGKGDVRLVLDNVDISAEGAPAIKVLSGDTLHIVLSPGSCNRIKDSADDPLKAALCTKADTTIEGNGCLGITAPAGYGIFADGADVTFRSGDYLICSAGSGIRCDRLELDGGRVFVNTKADEPAEAKKISENGGLLQRTDAADVCSICSCCGKTAAVRKTSGSRPSCSGCCRPTTDRPGFIAQGITWNSAGMLKPDMAAAADIVFGSAFSSAVIDKGGTYILSGSSGEGSITVKKGTKGVVLVLRDLDLTSSSGAAIRINDDAEVQILVEGRVVLNETSDQSAGGAAILAGNNTAVHVTGSGIMEIKSLYDGISTGAGSSLVADGSGITAITAGHDGIRSGGDIAVLGGSLAVAAVNDGIHADNVLTIGREDGTGPDLSVLTSTEGIEGDVVNIRGGALSINATEDGIEAEDDANLPGAPEPSVNISGGAVNVKAGGSAIDSDGNVNLTGGDITLRSSEDRPCIDQAGELYISKDADLDCDCGQECNH